MFPYALRSNLKSTQASTLRDKLLFGLDDIALREINEKLNNAKESPNGFSVKLMKAGKDLPPLLGKWKLEGQRLHFMHLFPLRPASDYSVLLTLPQKAVELTFSTPEMAEPAPPAKVEQVYPTADELPQNLLRMYIQFSQPMSRGEAYQNIVLLDRHGQVVENPFLPLPQELWDPGQRRFALLFDPGRIKQGLVPHDEMGPPLLPNETYTLVIKKSWHDSHGRELTEEFRKEFSVIEPWTDQLDETKWTIEAPSLNSRDPLTVRFDRLMNFGMLFGSLRVQQAGERIEGEIHIDNEESAWSFTPSANWNLGEYELVIDSDLEDVAGNRLSRPFEVDLISGETPQQREKVIRLPFKVEQ
ncbi:MAG: hypothetical protein R3C03_06775 [Pirellulaceae bacterium]